MAMLEKKNIDSPDEVRQFAGHGHVDVVTLGEFVLGRGTFEPGWKWSNDVKPIAGTDSCQVAHTGIFIAGSMTVRADDGTEVTYSAGDVCLMAPGHDAWVEGDEACIIYDTGAGPYAKKAG